MGFKKEKKVKKGAPAWMATYSDLMTLLLVFFILLFSFSEIDATKFRMIADSFKGILEDSSSFILDNPPSSPIDLDFTPVEKEKNKKQLDQLLAEVQQYLKEHDLEGVITATREERGVELVLQEDVLFDSGQAVVKMKAKPFLDTVANLLKEIPNLIEIEGHTDSQRIIQPSMYVSNWNLSGDRAANVANYFINEHLMPSDRFKISGFADTIPIATNTTAEGRMQNRRVILVILEKTYDEYMEESAKDVNILNLH